MMMECKNCGDLFEMDLLRKNPNHKLCRKCRPWLKNSVLDVMVL